MNKIITLLIMLALTSFPALVSANKTVSMEALLEQVKQGNRDDQKANAQRLAQFRQAQSQQANVLAELSAQRQAAEQLSQQKERAFSDNEQNIAQLQQQLHERLGSLKELFGVLQISTTDAQSAFYGSLSQMHFPERIERLNAFAQKMEQTVELPSISEIEQLWFEMHREILETGKARVSEQPVLMPDGNTEVTKVVRVGAFNLIADGQYVQRLPETGQLVAYAQQPASRYRTGANALADLNTQTGVVPLTIDPIRGQLMALLGTAPKITDRINQGGIIGYIIIGLGTVVILIALARLALLMMQEQQIKKQMQHPDEPKDNPLGRVFAVYEANKNIDVETLEIKLSEAILLELPKINRWVSFIKIAAAIAPLMGLLGTVTGMIITFQAITLFGAGDPKLMAGGISQALVTTVLGLTVAIPSLLLHNLLQTKAAKLSDILEQEAVAMVAEHTELKVADKPYASAA